MSAVTNQPLPFGRLERENHIQMIFRAFRGQARPSCESQVSPGPQPHPVHSDWASRERLSGLVLGNKTGNGHVRAPGALSGPEVGEQRLGDAAGPDCMEMLDTVSQIHITARPELQGQSKWVCAHIYLSVKMYKRCFLDAVICPFQLNNASLL